jgi:hypothetical protein
MSGARRTQWSKCSLSNRSAPSSSTKQSTYLLVATRLSIHLNDEQGIDRGSLGEVEIEELQKDS